MTLSLILVGLQVVVIAFALLRESGTDNRFEGDTLGYRS